VLQAKLIVQNGDRMQASMRVCQKHILTAVLDTTYDITYGQLDKEHGYSVSRSTRIAEIDSPGTASERALNAREEHGFLWRLNTYWSYEEKDGGLYLQIEAISLTRSIPHGLGWVIRPYLESIPPRIPGVHIALHMQRAAQVVRIAVSKKGHKDESPSGRNNRGCSELYARAPGEPGSDRFA
jgi:hypothetical protein